MAAAHTITIEDEGQSYRCAETNTVLEGMRSLGKKGIPVGCRSGGCGVCKVKVTCGDYATRVMSREHVSAEEQAAGIVLACRIQPRSDLSLQVIGKMKNALSRGDGELPAAASIK